MATKCVVNKATLTDIADAIREKGGTTDTMLPSEMAAAIEAIPSGGRGPEAGVKDVNFYDYDGFLLYSYTLIEAVALTDLPGLPSVPGLVCQGWNYTLAQIKAYGENATEWVSGHSYTHGEYVFAAGALWRCMVDHTSGTEWDDANWCDVPVLVNVGAIYTTDDGCTRITLDIAEGGVSQPLALGQADPNGVSVDWGDGTQIETYAETEVTVRQHVYARPGTFTISINPRESSIVFGTGGIFGSYSSGTPRLVLTRLTEVNIGRDCNLPDNLLQYSGAVRVTIPNTVTSLGTSPFSNSATLVHVNIPNSVTNRVSSTFTSDTALKSVSVPESITDYFSFRYQSCTAIKRVSVPRGVDDIVNYLLNNTGALEGAVSFPSSVTKIGFYNTAITVKRWDFTRVNAVVSLTSTSFKSGVGDDAKIVVPDWLYDDWIEATNWSDVALVGKIVKGSEYSEV